MRYVVATIAGRTGSSSSSGPAIALGVGRAFAAEVKNLRRAIWLLHEGSTVFTHTCCVTEKSSFRLSRAATAFVLGDRFPVRLLLPLVITIANY
jgi:hypothetical protein